MFLTKSELEKLEFTYLLFHMSDVLNMMISFERVDIPKIREAVKAADFQLKEALRKRRSVIYGFEEKSACPNATLRNLQENLLKKRTHLLDAEIYLETIASYGELVDKVIQQWD